LVKQTSLKTLLKTSIAALKDGKRDEALAAARTAVQMSPDSLEALHCLADALTMYTLYRFDTALAARLAADGSLAEAISTRKRLVSLGVEECDNYLQLGYCLTILGEFAEAAVNIRRATDLYPPNLHKVPGRVPRSAQAMTPDFLIIGAAKCGTTSLLSYIFEHPLVLAPILKETNYFLYPERGLAWFQAHFPRLPQKDKGYITGEASVSTLAVANGPETALQVNPKVRLFALARDPVDRAISHHANNVWMGVEKRTLDDAINEELEVLESEDSSRRREYETSQQGYLWSGLYAQDLERWLASFPRDQLCIILTEDMQAHHEETMEHVFQFLGLPPYTVSTAVMHNRGVYDPQDESRARIRARMGEFFAKPNERFFELIGRRLNWTGNTNSRGPLVPSASKARILLAKQLWKDASIELAECLRAAPSHPDRQEWLEQRCLALLDAREVDSARTALADLAREFPDNTSLPAASVRVAELANDPAETAEVIQDSLRRYPRHPDRGTWLQSLGRALIQLRQWQRSVDVFETIAAAYPEEPLGVFGLAKAAEGLGNTAHALQLFEIYAERFPRDPARHWRLLDFALLLLKQDLLPQAEQVIAGYRIEFPSEADGFSCLALLEQRRGNREKAIDHWMECLRRFPDHPNRRWWLPNLTNLLIDKGDLAGADNLIDEMLIAFPDQPGGLVSLARLASLRDDPERAAEIWEKCLDTFPGHPERFWWLPTYGHALLTAGQTDRGEQQFRQALAEFPNEPVSKAGLARVAGDRGKWHDAEQILLECISDHPTHKNRHDWENMLLNARARLHSQRT
jgi:tetratricopeptide (TPR) repeat protein